MNDFARKVAFLSRPEAWPGEVRRVERVDTHFSAVFLTEDRVYKLKKPQRVDVLDLRTLADREANCAEEVRVNQRFSPDVYLGVLALTEAEGRLAVGGTGEVVDWIVAMRRLPAEHMLDEVIARGTLAVHALRPAAERFARFHLAQPALDLSAAAYRAWLQERVEENRRELVDAAHGLPSARVEAICAAQRRRLDASAAHFDARVAAGRIVDGHGDLRPEHVCLDPPRIIDCLEFDARMRRMDAVHELCFLALECRRLGAPEVGATFLDTWRELADDAPPAELLAFYTSHRAMVRARLAAWRIHDEDSAAPPAAHSREQANWYLDQAEAALA